MPESFASSTPDRDPFALQLPGGRVVAAAQITWRATTSGGPGGQHANRTASRVEVRVAISDLPLTARETAQVYERLAARIFGAGELAVSCGEHRDQHRNRRVATRRLERLIRDAIAPRTPRIATKPSLGARLRRREDKQQTSQRKRQRGWAWNGDDD